MLERAHTKHPEVTVVKMGLQEMHFEEILDDVICMDAMEFVFPEDWPLVMDNLHQAIKAGGFCYFTVELAAEQDIERDFQAGLEMGLPVVYGESVVGAGYHYFPNGRSTVVPVHRGETLGPGITAQIVKDTVVYG